MTRRRGRTKFKRRFGPAGPVSTLPQQEIAMACAMRAPEEVRGALELVVPEAQMLAMFGPGPRSQDAVAS